jgi:hypothetical protein
VSKGPDRATEFNSMLGTFCCGQFAAITGVAGGEGAIHQAQASYGYRSTSGADQADRKWVCGDRRVET